MTTNLLPLALLALILPGPALASPTTIIYRTTAPLTTLGLAATVPGYGPAPAYAMPSYAMPTYAAPAPQPRSAVVRYRVPVSYGAPSAAPYGYGAPAPYGMVAAPAATVAQRCTPDTGRVLLGAAMGGLASVALAPRARDRRWAVPVGAAIGGLGGLATGC